MIKESPFPDGAAQANPSSLFLADCYIFPCRLKLKFRRHYRTGLRRGKNAPKRQLRFGNFYSNPSILTVKKRLTKTNLQIIIGLPDTFLLSKP